jgi:putative transport protein
MDFIRGLLEQQPLMALFLTIAIGYLVGEINLKGFSLGAGAVLFVALAVGWFAPKSAPAPMIGSFGLAIFLYAVGVQYGKQFFQGLTSPDGIKANIMALTGVLLSGAVSLGFIRMFALPPGHALGLFAGAGTSTATLQAAILTLGNNDAAVGYSVGYPFGVAGPILALYLTFIILKPKIEVASTNMALLEIALRNPDFIGKRLGEVMDTLPAGVKIVALRHEHHNFAASRDMFLAEDDVVLATGPDRDTLDKLRENLGEAAPGRIAKDRSDIDYLRVFASRPDVVGRALGDLDMPGKALVIQVRRGDVDLLPQPDLVLEYGDRVGVFANRAEFPALRKYFGDSIKATAEFSYISIGLGMALGFLLGAISVTLPGIGKVSFGLAGVLIVGLILGKLRRTGKIHWTMPLSANVVLRNLGLTIFLAQVGMSSGPKFAATVSATGFLMLGLACVAVAALVVPVILMGLFLFKMPYDQVAGIAAGATGNPAILAYGSKLAPTEKPDVGYAMIFPGMTIVKILFVNIVPALLL